VSSQQHGTPDILVYKTQETNIYIVAKCWINWQMSL